MWRNGFDLFVCVFSRLKAKLESLEAEYVENLEKTQTKYTSELAALRERIKESEANRDTLQKEAKFFKEKVDSIRFDRMSENEEATIELKRLHDREKLLLMAENDRLLNQVRNLKQPRLN
jgi:predicted nuclease with TOPRIM domain